MTDAAWATVYRTMIGDPAGNAPTCGSKPSMLGVRPGTDVKLDDSTVRFDRNRARGLSVAPRPEDLPPPHRPIGLHGGESPLPCWALEAKTLSEDADHLHVVPTKATHGVVATTEDVAINELQDRLCKTKERWNQWNPPTQAL